jgi:phenylpyruvate tautomerase PptA (4-oxalocrotonate tautomerase family)
MPMIHVHYQAGSLSAERKRALAEKLTDVLIEVEGGGAVDGPKARSIA